MCEQFINVSAYRTSRQREKQPFVCSLGATQAVVSTRRSRFHQQPEQQLIGSTHSRDYMEIIMF